MADGLKISSWYAKNPLGIIALFISLIYGCAALLTGTSVSALTADNQTLLVRFVVLFPPAVLVVFAWLVAKHHKKLYAPGDYRSDEGFLNAGANLPPEALAQRLSEEVAAEEADVHADLDLGVPDEGRQRLVRLEAVQAPRTAVASEKSTMRRDKLLEQTYLVEGLVFQELQNELSGAVRRQISLALPSRQKIEIDGLVETPGGTYIIEVKFARYSHVINRRLRDARNQILRLSAAIKDANLFSNVHFILALVLDRSGSESKAVKNEITALQAELLNIAIVRKFSYEDLLQKYGFPASVNTTDSLTPPS